MKVVEASEMARIEKVAIEEGASGDTFMQKAAEGIAISLDAVVQSKNLEKVVTLVAGKGNNGGDGYCVALLLKKKGYQIQAFSIAPLHECSPLCQKYAGAFEKKCSKIKLLEKPEDVKIPEQGIVLDAILGTGFKGKPTSFLEGLFYKMNQSKAPIFSIDIPSGLNGDTGVVEGEAIEAQHTFFLGLPKKGFFFNEGWNLVGQLHDVNFGLQDKYLKEAHSDFELMTEKEIRSFLPKIVRNRHKYQAGYVIGIAGSKGMMGASTLSGMAALKVGAGMVKVLHLEDEYPDSAAYPELIHKTYRYDQLDDILQLMEKATAVYVGPGIGTSKKMQEFISALLPKLTKPCVLDADALNIISMKKLSPPKKSILTPHAGEMKRLLAEEPKDFSHMVELCQQYVEKHDVTLILKGGPSFIFRKGAKALINPTGDPGMATAGSGDVLTGMLAGFLSQEGMDPEKTAQLAVYLHGKVGEIVAEKKSSYSLTATDLLKFMYKVF